MLDPVASASPISMTTDDTRLRAAVREFFTYLDATEDSELSGREFHPVTLGCCRAMWVEPLGKVIMEMKRLSAEPPTAVIAMGDPIRDYVPGQGADSAEENRKHLRSLQAALGQQVEQEKLP